MCNFHPLTSSQAKNHEVAFRWSIRLPRGMIATSHIHDHLRSAMDCHLHRLETQYGRSGRFGGTMIDMIVTILLMSIVSAVTVPRMTEVLAMHRLEATAYELVGGVNYLKDRAVIEGRDLVAQFTAEPPGMRCDQVAMPNRPGQTFALNLTSETNLSGFTYSGFTGNSLRFDRFGDIHDSAGRVNNCSISLSSAKAIATITIHQGNATVVTQRK